MAISVSPDARRARILVVEDEAIVARDIQSLLDALGYEPVGHASRGEQAVTLIEQLRPDLVLMDIQLAGDMDGIAVAHAVRAMRSVPIVFLTAFSADAVIARAKLTEPYGYILKPFSERELRTVIEMALYKHAAEGRLQLALQHSQAIVDNMVDAVITISDRGLIESFNKAASSIFGYAPPEVLGRNFSMLMTEFHRQRHDGYLLRFQATAEPRIIGMPPRDIDARRKDGSVFPMNLSVSEIVHAGRVSYIGLIRDVSERVRSETALRENARQVTMLSRRVLQAQETERRRIAHELHDELGQSLTAIKINLQAQVRLKGEPPTQLGADNLRIVEDALQQVRRLAMALRPSVLDDLGLVPALRWMAEQTSARIGVAINFRPAMPQVRLPPEVETACFRIVQETLTNVARHANARNVDIDLFHDGDALVLDVHDDGCGFNMAAVQERAAAGDSIGLLGMKERAMLIGGRLEVESVPGLGSTVRLRCPMQMQEQVQ